jgi:O-antigen biosynthesis protein
VLAASSAALARHEWSPQTAGSLLGDIRPVLTPAAVRIVDLEKRLADLWLPTAPGGQPYRSLVAVARLGGDPLGAATIAADEQGRVSRDQLAFLLRRRSDGEPQDTLARHASPRSLQRSSAPSRTDHSSERRARPVSVVVTTCCDPAALERCLQSVLACDHPAFEVIVVENRPGSASTRSMLKQRFADDPRVRYVEEPRRGLSRARNAGLAVAEGDVVAFTDDDVVADVGWIRRCDEPFERAGDVACVTGLILPLKLETQPQLLLEQLGGFSRGFHRRIWRLPEARHSHPLIPYTAGVFGSGANTAVRRHVARQLGGFDPRLGTGTPTGGGEELDFYIRLLRDGHAIAYEPSAIIWHEHPERMWRLRRQVYRYGVGLGAALAKQLLVGPNRMELLRVVPDGIHYARDPTSRKNLAKPPDYPRRLDWLERLGILMGPPAYVMSAFEAARARHYGLSDDHLRRSQRSSALAHNSVPPRQTRRP